MAGVGSLDVLRQVALVAEPFQAGGEEATERLFSRVLSLVCVNL